MIKTKSRCDTEQSQTKSRAKPINFINKSKGRTYWSSQGGTLAVGQVEEQERSMF